MGHHPGEASLVPKAGARTPEDFFTLIRPHVSDLRDHARRELKILEIEGTLHSGEVTTADLVDEVLVRAWQQFSDRPKDASLKTWLVDLLHVVLGEWINQEPRPHVSLDEQVEDVLPEDIPQVDDQEWWMVLLGYNDTSSLTDLVDEAQAKERRIGRFEQCDGGTIFLDEIGDMPLGLQAKILRLLQEQTFERVGGNDTIKTDVRVIAATHRDLKKWSEVGKFRFDLYYRLGVVTIHLPPLRDRGDDLVLLARLFLRRFSVEMKCEPCQITSEGLRQLHAYPWPGNVRELQSVLKRAMVRTAGSLLSADSLFPDSSVLAREKGLAVARRDQGLTLEEMEKQAIQQYLLQTGGNRKQTAALLGISTRTLLRQIRAHGLEDPRRRGPDRGSSST